MGPQRQSKRALVAGSQLTASTFRACSHASRVIFTISGGLPTRIGGPQNPTPRETYNCPEPCEYRPAYRGHRSETRAVAGNN